MSNNILINPEHLAALSNLEAEQSVIGGLLLNNTARAKMGELSDKAFYFLPNRLIFRAILSLLNQNQPADVMTVEDVLKQHDKLDDVGGFDYLISVAQNTPSAANIAKYASIVRERHAKRELLQAAQDIADTVTEQDGTDLQTKQAKAMQLLTKALEMGSKQSSASWADEILRETLVWADEILARPENELLGFRTGIKKLDYVTQGLRRGDLTVIGGRPSMGKSALGENIARQVAKDGGIVRYQSYEMGKRDLLLRGAAAECEIDFGNVRRMRFSQDEWGKFSEFGKFYAGLRLSVDTAALTVDEIAAECRLLKQSHGLDMLVIDHLHLMPLRDSRNAVKEYDEIAAKLKRLAIELDIHVLLLAQLNRGSESRINKRPTMADIRESGGIEQSANLIIFPYRPAYHDSNENPTLAELIIAKNRDGVCDTLQIGWFGKWQKFTNEYDPFAQPEKITDEKVNEAIPDYAC